jgi:NAD(P)-dependent dehydrogenase (short-subunit alcohol dehydrogenase family)
MAPFDGQVCAVTGGARGIGLALARRFVRRGARVAILDQDDAAAAESARELCRETGREIRAYRADVSRSGDVASAFDAIGGDFGRLDVLVNNAGLALIGPSEQVPESDWRVQVDVMLTGVFLCCQRAFPLLRRQRSGAIVSISSVGGLGGWPGRAAYNAAKAGVITLTEVLACEWGKYGIRVNAVAPGVVRTPLLERAIAEGVATEEAYVRRAPIGRLADPDEIAQVVAFLAGPHAGYVTGATVRVDGGWAAWSNPRPDAFEWVPGR